MCFNLGATPQSIALQKNTSITLLDNGTVVTNTYLRSANERTLYGDLFQWGRIADGHENRDAISINSTGGDDINDNCVSWNTTTPPTYENGATIGTIQYPWQQVARSSTNYYGRFIKTTVDNDNFNWYAGVSTTQSNADLLWRESAFPSNDPCQHINNDGTTYYTFYPASSDPTSSSTGWRIPNPSEWASLYRGGAISGSPANAYANTWSWYQFATGTAEGAKGYEIKPDGVTTTLFLPAVGNRNSANAMLYYSGSIGRYWSGSASGVNAVCLSITSAGVYPAFVTYRGYGFALRCVKN